MSDRAQRAGQAPACTPPAGAPSDGHDREHKRPESAATLPPPTLLQIPADEPTMPVITGEDTAPGRKDRRCHRAQIGVRLRLPVTERRLRTGSLRRVGSRHAVQHPSCKGFINSGLTRGTIGRSIHPRTAPANSHIPGASKRHTG